MKKFLQKFNDFELTILLEGVIGIVAIGLSFIGFAFAQSGWAIGVSTGVLVSMISTVLVFKGSDAALREGKTALYLLYYFLRMILFAGTIVIFALLQYKWNYPKFDYSIWGALIGYMPMVILLVVGQVKSTHKIDKKIKEKEKEE